MTVTVRVELPAPLCLLAGIRREVRIACEGPATLRSVLDALETEYPMLLGTVRDSITKVRRPFIRFFACEEDLSHISPDEPLPEAVVLQKEPLLIIGAIAGG